MELLSRELHMVLSSKFDSFDGTSHGRKPITNTTVFPDRPRLPGTSPRQYITNGNVQYTNEHLNRDQFVAVKRKPLVTGRL